MRGRAVQVLILQGRGHTLAVRWALVQGPVLLLPWGPCPLTLRSRASFMVCVDALVAADPLLPLTSPPVMSGPCHLGCAPTSLSTLH